MRPISELTAEEIKEIRYVLHDIDDTITDEGKLRPEAYQALWDLQDAGFQVIPVTGRPAGWCDLILRQWPVAGVVGENGAFADYWKGGHPTRFFHPSVPKERLSDRLSEIRDACLSGVPGCRVAADQPYRVCDLAIDFAEDEPKLSLEDAGRIKAICESMGAVAKVSSIHVNTWFGDYDKLSMALLFLKEILGEEEPEKRVIFFGDSPNDEPMFAHFPLSVGVANLTPFAPTMAHLPGYITSERGGRGFAEAAALLIQGKRG